jgi:toxin CptA
MRNAVAPCRIVWRPSRWESGGVLLLGACAAAGAWVSDLAWPWARTVAGMAAMLACAQAHRASQRRVRRLVIADGATLDGVGLATCRIAWRGPLAFVQARDGSGDVHRLAWWPDTLSRSRRRALRLAMDAMAHASSH